MSRKDGFLVFSGLLGIVMMMACHSAVTRDANPKAGASSEPNSAGLAAARKGEIRLSLEAQVQTGIRTVIAHAAAIPEAVLANGSLMPNEDRTWTVSSYSLGRVAALETKVGDWVNAGQVLVRMHSHEVHDSRAAYKQALAALEEARAQQVFANKAFARAQRLLALQAISQGQMEQAQTDLERAQTMVESAQAGVRREETHLRDVLHVPVESTGSEASEMVPVAAPAHGVLIERLVSVGTVVNPGTPMFRITDPATLWLIAAVNEADLGKVRLGQKVELHVRAYPDRTFHGVTSWLGESLDPATRTLQVRVTVPNGDHALKPEMYVNAAFEGTASRQAISVPESAIGELSGQRVVFLQTSPSSFIPRLVTTGTAADGLVEIRQGIAEGDRIVVAGNYGLKSEILKSSLSEGE